MIDLHDNAVVAELARQQSIETGESVYSVCPAGKQAVVYGLDDRRHPPRTASKEPSGTDDAHAGRWELRIRLGSSDRVDRASGLDTRSRAQLA